ncbi:hypothetical protein C8J57DRAFT_1239607 [Mycena rebaudengoi]|nr:hypothetical protein C8J57DRAFT_1239607 [Mycena rebaudengoi]
MFPSLMFALQTSALMSCVSVLVLPTGIRQHSFSASPSFADTGYTLLAHKRTHRIAIGVRFRERATLDNISIDWNSSDVVRTEWANNLPGQDRKSATRRAYRGSFLSPRSIAVEEWHWKQHVGVRISPFE